jgi:hypothetical protein
MVLAPLVDTSGAFLKMSIKVDVLPDEIVSPAVPVDQAWDPSGIVIGEVLSAPDHKVAEPRVMLCKLVLFPGPGTQVREILLMTSGDMPLSVISILSASELLEEIS